MRHKIIFCTILLLFPFSYVAESQENLSREEFYEFMNDYIMQFFVTRQAIDTALSRETNLELQVRTWNGYVEEHLPKKFYVSVPVMNVSVGKETYNRSAVDIKYDFQIEIPKRRFRYENNLATEGIRFKLEVIPEKQDDVEWVILKPSLGTLEVKSDLARKYNILKNSGNLVFEIRLNYSREAGWTQFFQTVVSLNSIRWVVDDGTIWEIGSLPFETIFYRDKQK